MRIAIWTAVCLIGLAYPGSTMAMGDESHEQMSSVGAQTISASGTVKSIASDHTSVRIFHNPISALNWPAMNMPFEVADPESVSSLHVGDKINFDFVQKEGRNVIVKISR